MKTALQPILPAMLACVFACGAPAQELPVADAANAQARAARPTKEAVHLERVADRHCLRATGSRVIVMRNANADRPQERCAIGPGRVHTSEDLERTGAAGLGQALRRLEPSSR